MHRGQWVGEGSRSVQQEDPVLNVSRVHAFPVLLPASPFSSGHRPQACPALFCGAAAPPLSEVPAGATSPAARGPRVSLVTEGMTEGCWRPGLGQRCGRTGRPSTWPAGVTMNRPSLPPRTQRTPEQGLSVPRCLSYLQATQPPPGGPSSGLDSSKEVPAGLRDPCRGGSGESMDPQKAGSGLTAGGAHCGPGSRMSQL